MEVPKLETERESDGSSITEETHSWICKGRSSTKTRLCGGSTISHENKCGGSTIMRLCGGSTISLENKCGGSTISLKNKTVEVLPKCKCYHWYCVCWQKTFDI